jgi:hypothetical protein
MNAWLQAVGRIIIIRKDRLEMLFLVGMQRFVVRFPRRSGGGSKFKSEPKQVYKKSQHHDADDIDRKCRSNYKTGATNQQKTSKLVSRSPKVKRRHHLGSRISISVN